MSDPSATPAWYDAAQASVNRVRAAQREEGEALLHELRLDVSAASTAIAHIVRRLAEKVNGYRVDNAVIEHRQRERCMEQIKDALNDLVWEARAELDDYAASYGRWAP